MSRAVAVEMLRLVLLLLAAPTADTSCCVSCHQSFCGSLQNPGLVTLDFDGEAQRVDSTGMNFMVVFPENIAYYHPQSPDNNIWVTALQSGTEVTVTQSSSDTQTQSLDAGYPYSFYSNLELKNNLSFETFRVSSSTISVSSNKVIVVQAISIKKNSVQTALVIPTDKLGKKYFIPPIPDIQGTTDDPVLNVTEKGPFRLIIVNSDGQNTVTLNWTTEKLFTLQPKQVAQTWITNDQVTPGAAMVVEAEKPIAVLFSHPCAMQTNCTCGLLTAMLPPARNQTVKFPIPPILAENAHVLVSDERSRKSVLFDPASAAVDSSGTVILYRPGLLLTLIPETEFASCFSLPFVTSKTNFAVIVVLKNSTNGIHIGNNPLDTQKWQDLMGTDYVSTNYSLTSNKTVIWHNSSNMAVYLMGYDGPAWFGNPAPVISTTPDFRGCSVTPENLTVLTQTQNWRASIGSCEGTGLNLISLSKAHLQRQVCNKLRSGSDQKVWIGMRRSSVSGDWYWLNDNEVGNTNWDTGEPGSVDEGQCALMSLRNNCTWRDEDCCNTYQSICYKEPEFFFKLT